MKRILFLLSTSFLVGCNVETTTEEQDVAENCECMNDTTNYNNNNAPCVKLMQKINEKYEYDPKAAEYIKNEVTNCGAN